ncbi:hypothetical protein EDB86DRAFT_323649 [Lactarius hatsudake]|nr:hypothetical protein EDB86DRAFT_323649 [Lactarius hatsudake]
MTTRNPPPLDETQTTPSQVGAPRREHRAEAEAQGGVASEGPSGLWSEYLKSMEEQDKQTAERYQGEADSTLIFTGLFSAVVTVSLVESYKWLSPDPADETVKLLAQISQQLVNISNGVPLESISAGSNQPFKPTISAVMVNVTWFCSVVLTLGCSVGATLIQQQTRRYLMLTQRPGAPYERARLRTFLFNGHRKFQVDTVHQLLAMFVHISILLYCVGLVIQIFTISKGIGSLTLGPFTLGPLTLGYLSIIYLSIFYLVYAGLTVWPFFSFDCPYGTPFTPLVWCLFHFCSFGVFAAVRHIKGLFHGPGKWFKERVNEHRHRFWDGLQRTVELHGIEAQQSVDANALEWTLKAIIETKEIENFATSVPKFFDTYARLGAPEPTSPRMSDQPPTNPIFGFRLLETCMLGTSAGEERKNRLQMCLKCLLYWAREFNQNSAPLPSYFPLPDSDMARRLQAEQDPTSTQMGRCFSALVAKKLAADVNSCHSSGVRGREAKLASLLAILEMETHERDQVENFLSQPGAIGLVNIVSLVASSEMNTLITEGAPPEALAVFEETVDILLAKDFLTSLDATHARLPPELVDSFHRTYFNAQAPKWLTTKLRPIKERLPAPEMTERV